MISSEEAKEISGWDGFSGQQSACSDHIVPAEQCRALAALGEPPGTENLAMAVSCELLWERAPLCKQAAIFLETYRMFPIVLDPHAASPL